MKDEVIIKKSKCVNLISSKGGWFLITILFVEIFHCYLVFCSILREFNIVKDASFLSIISTLKFFMCMINFSSSDLINWIMEDAISFVFFSIYGN